MNKDICMKCNKLMSTHSLQDNMIIGKTLKELEFMLYCKMSCIELGETHILVKSKVDAHDLKDSKYFKNLL